MQVMTVTTDNVDAIKNREMWVAASKALKSTKSISYAYGDLEVLAIERDVYLAINEDEALKSKMEIEAELAFARFGDVQVLVLSGARVYDLVTWGEIKDEIRRRQAEHVKPYKAADFVCHCERCGESTGIDANKTVCLDCESR